MIVPVILSGGVGSRLWPLSRQAHPKPFIKLNDGESLLQKAYQRALGASKAQELITVTNRELYFYSKDEYAQLAENAALNTFLLEPEGRNSSAAIAVAALYAQREHGNKCNILVLPADHLIQNITAFQQAVERAAQLATSGKLVTFGIVPTAPETAYGYIKANAEQVEEFVEKPDLATAKQYLAHGGYYWNSGMFCLNVAAFLNELEKHNQDILQSSQLALEKGQFSSNNGTKQCELPAAEFSKIRSISVDYAVFEKSSNIAVVPCDIGWSDIGSWTEFGALSPMDAKGNNLKGEVVLNQVENCIIHGNDKLIAAVGVEDLIIADTADALLVANKSHAQQVRHLVDELKNRANPAYKEFPTVHRPWGTYTVLQEGAGFKLKRIEVKPNARLSLQSHRYRSEHWVVVSGKALVTNGEQLLELLPNQSTYIPAGNKHRLENRTLEKLVLIEVQCGDYLGEDDIIRYSDEYGRSSN